MAKQQLLWRSVLVLALGVAVGIVSGLTLGALRARSDDDSAKNGQNQQIVHSALCNALHPRTDADALGSAVLPATAAGRRGPKCQEACWDEMGHAGLGHRIGNYLATIAAGLAWGVPPLIGANDADRCGPHGCYAGAEAALGLARGLRREASFLGVDRVPVRGWEHGTSLRAVLNKGRSGCRAVWLLGQEFWLRDLTIVRPALSAQIAKAVNRDHALPPWETSDRVGERVVVAVHIRYGNSGDRHKETSEGWLKTLLRQLEKIVLNSTLARGNVNFHIFTGGSGFPWLHGLHGAIVHGKEIDAVRTFRSIAEADVVVCGHSSLCFHAALSQHIPLALVPHNQEPFPYNMCPQEMVCVAPSGELTPEQQIRFRDAIERTSLARRFRCPLLRPAT